tara:strand:+ start:1250 stop:2221 length:972 start_codon:yes stop_codon:yes gene_type:complete
LLINNKMKYNNSINFGYACVNMQLANPKQFSNPNQKRIISHRSMIKKTFIEKGLPYASSLALKNCEDLFEIVKWNKKNNFNFFRISSDIFPWCSEYELSDLPDYNKIKKILFSIGNFVRQNNIRITSHPGPFNVLTSPRKTVVENCLKDLSIHGETFDLMNLSRSTYNKINIHIGGAYGDKQSSLKRFCDNFKLLPKSVKSRLTVENDDRASLYSVKDLYEGVYKNISIPIVFDYHHHKFCNGGLNEKEALSLSISTWNGIKPVVHYSESRSIEKNDKSIKPHAHSDYIYNYINTYSEPLDIMIEAKCKELAVLRYIEKYSLK